jgi:hydrogenase-4 component B
VQGLAGDRMPAQLANPWLSIVPIAQGRSSYNALLVFGFIAASATMAAFLIHRLASRGLRRAPIWDCGYPDARRTTQYSAASFAQPIRRVLGSVAYRSRQVLDMPPPGDTRAATLVVDLGDRVWSMLYAPVGNAVAFVADRLNFLQYLTIRQYLSFVFLSLVTLLIVLAIWF